jgi:hypothetical protein
MKKEDISIAAKNSKAVSTEIVTVYAISPLYKRRPLIISPIYDENINGYRYGLADIDKGKLEQEGFNTGMNDSYQLKNMDRLTLKKDKDNKYLLTNDFVRYNMALLNPEVAHSKAEAVAGVHVMYMHNVEMEAKAEVDTRKTSIKATAKIANITDEQMKDMLYYFGLKPSEMSVTVRESNCYRLVDEKPLMVIEYFESKDSSRIVFVKKLLAHGIIKKDANGLITSSLGTIGFGDVAAAAYIYDEKNDQIFNSLTELLNTKI